ncbi:hypothetical protein ACFL27_11050 [candidate division CSSED10-310 bacterium]|uniref:Outer membrane protein beta-barrel domain-containing protein n=1 Tax=candidate division CSSED10-310 bacterium TaxID=2855610 RepID=A0ABV6YWZ4_UNCC1
MERDYYHSLFLLYEVDVVFAGHEHLYAHQEIDGITYITTGGAGSPLYGGMPESFYHFVRFIKQDGYLHFQVIKPAGEIHEKFKFLTGESKMHQRLLYVMFSIFIYFVIVPPGECSSSFVVRLGVFDNSDPRIEEYYGYGPVGSLEYEWIHKSGFGVKPSLAVAFSEKVYQDQEQSLTRIMAGVIFTYHTLREEYRFDPYFGFGYFYMYTNENTGEGFQDFSEGGFPSSAVGYAMEFGLNYTLTEHLSLSWQTQYSLSKVVSKYTLGDLDYGGWSSGIGIRIRF